MTYNFAADSFHTKKLCSFKRSAFLMKIGRFAFLRPPLGNLGATYGDHLRLIGKRAVFFRMVYKSGQIFLPFCQGSRV